MDVMTLKAILTLDSSQFDSGLASASSAASKLGSIGGKIGGVISSGLKVAGAAFTAAGAAVGAFAKSSIDAGMTFDQSMSQVYATMGDKAQAVVEQGKYAGMEASAALRDFAQEMGRTTQFSATQSADALNYMALAGYTAEQSMAMLPNVMNLAAAGAMDLARASDMITDSQTALGLTFEQTNTMVDQMAKTASTTNTSVEQLGDAFLTVGGTAKYMYSDMENGITVTDEMNKVLGVLADNGIKGSEAGTHLRNMLLKLSSPTSEGAKLLDKFGDAVGHNLVFDEATGQMRQFQDIFQDLNVAMSDMTDEQKLQAFSDIFNTRDVAAANALLGTTAERWDEIGDAIMNADGAAEEMAKTQLDNLAGDVTLFKSALEGAKIAISDMLTPALRNFVQLGTDGMSQVADALRNGDMAGAIAVIGDVLSQGLNMIIEKLPSFLQAGGDLLKALGDGLVQNMPMIMDAATQITSQFVQFIAEGAPEFIECAVQILSAIGQGIMNNLDLLIETAVSIITQLGLAFLDAAPQLLEAGVQILLGLVEGISESLPVLIPAAVEAIVAIATALIENIDLLVEAAIQLALGLANGLIQATPVIIQAIPTLVEAIVTAIIENLPLLLEAAIQIHMALAQALVENAPLLLESIIQIFTMIGEMIITYGSQFVEQAGTIISNVVTAVDTWLSQLPTLVANYAGLMLGNFINTMISLPENIMELFNKVLTNLQNFGQKFIAEGPRIANEFKQKLIEIMMTIPDKMVEIGTNIVEGLKNGIAGAWESLKGWMGEMVSGFIDGVKAGLQIGSPSKVMADEIGKWIPAGIAVGIEDNMGVLNDAVDMMYGAVTPSLTTSTENDKTTVDIGTIIALLQNINDNTAEPIRLEGDMDRVFRVIQSKATANYRLTGNNSLVTI